jgi:hypothetical protein
MRSFTYAIALTLFAACGSSSSPKTSVDAPTSTTQHDAPVTTTIDAPPTTAAAMGLGKVCDQTHMCPTTGASTCVALTQGATHGFCTLSCGSGAVPAAGADPMPPAGGDAICMGSTPAPGAGTPACALSAAAANNMIPWDCAILCGTSGSTNLGDCPSGLVCTSNVCQ